MHIFTNLKLTTKKASFYSFSALLALAAVLTALHPGQANAGTLGVAFVRFDRLQASQTTTGTVCAKPTAASSTETTVQVTFPTGYTLGTAATFTVNTTNTAWPTSATPWLGINTATNVTGQVVTFPSTDLAAGTLYCFNWANPAAVTVKSSASSNNTGTITTRDSVPATIDSASFSTQSLTADSIAVSASVAQNFTFSLTGTTDSFGALPTGTINTSASPSTVAVTTNAATGWMVWAKDATTGLSSPSTGALIGSTTPTSNSQLTTTSEGYNMGVTSSQTGGTGTVSVPAPFTGGTLGRGGGLNTSLQLISSAAGSANATLTLKNNIVVTANTAAAADYADTITVVGAGMF